MEKLFKQLSFLLVIGLMYLKAGKSELTVTPRDTEVIISHLVYFNCSTSTTKEQIHWYHYRVGDNRTNYVYYRGQLNKVYGDRYSVAIDNAKGQNNLIIQSVQRRDAGRYMCQDDGGLGSQSSAELVVLEYIPICESSMNPDELVGPNICGLPMNELRLSCSVSYSGNIHPKLQWKMAGDDNPIVEGILVDDSIKGTTVVNLTKSPDVGMNNAAFTCSTTRSHSKYDCTTNRTKVNYALDHPPILNIAKGETITCTANANVPCIYRWFYGNDTLCPESCNKDLTTNRLKDHSCEASCTINGASCTYVAMRIFVYENETLVASEDKTKTLLLAILIPTVVFFLIVLIVSCVLFFKIRKVKAKNEELEVQVSVMHKTNVELRSRYPIDEKNQVLKNTEDELSNDVSPVNERPSVERGVETQPLLKANAKITETGIKEKEIKTKASKEMRRAIAGVAILEDLFYAVSENSSEVEAFDLKTFEYRNRWNVEELINPFDLVSCEIKKRLFIMDRTVASKPKCVVALQVDSDYGYRVLVRWSTEKEYGNLSVTSDGNVIVTFCTSRRLFIYGPDGSKLKVISLSEDIVHPTHALELSNGQYLISHGIHDDNIHRVCIIYENGELIKNSFEMMETPSYLAVDKAGVVFVADQGNSRVCALNSDLELVGVVVSKKDGLRCPQRICLDRRSGKIFVVDNEVLEFKRNNGKLLIFSYDL